jgi:pyridoxal 5'-phosphate synthase pdxS subunit
MMQLGADGIFVGSGIFKSEDPAAMAHAVVRATLHYRDAKVIAEVSEGIGGAMAGLEMHTLTPADRMQERGY